MILKTNKENVGKHKVFLDLGYSSIVYRYMVGDLQNNNSNNNNNPVLV